eukprot:2728008-Rhodomonas_salina.1
MERDRDSQRDRHRSRGPERQSFRERKAKRGKGSARAWDSRRPGKRRVEARALRQRAVHAGLSATRACVHQTQS